MARARKTTKAQKRHQRQNKQTKRTDDLVSHTASVFTCSTQLLTDLIQQCERIREDVECELFFFRIALEMWNQRTNDTVQIEDALERFVTELQRHLDCNNKLRDHFATLITDSTIHHYLNPIEKYRDLIRTRLA